MAEPRRPARARGPSFAERWQRVAAERPEDTFEAPRGALRAQSRRDFLLLGLAAAATAAVGWWLLPDRT